MGERTGTLAGLAMSGANLIGLEEDVFRNRRVLVTGHTGFKGSWLSIWLAELGAKIVGYSLPPPTEPSNFISSGVQELLFQHHEADVRDFERLQSVVKETKPEVVFHLAAQPLVRESYDSPRETFEANVMGTVNVLEAVRCAQIPCALVIVTSDKCYENREQVWGYRESDAMGGHDTYSASKGAAELVASSYRKSFFAPEQLTQHQVQVATARAGNVIGGGDWAKDRILTDVVRCLTKREPVPLRNPQAVRPWQHVLEPLSGYLQLAAAMLRNPSARWCKGWNFGPTPGDELPVAELVEKFCHAWGEGHWQDVSRPGQLHEAHFLRLSIDQAVAELGWRPIWRVDKAIERTARWFSEFHKSPEADSLNNCRCDIRQYSQQPTK